MSKQKLAHIERQAVWEAYDKRCFHCGESVPLMNAHIDHLIPESAENLSRHRKAFNLPSDFNVTDLRNLVLACQGCNLKKGKSDFLDLPIAMEHVSRALRKADLIARKIADLQAESDNDKYLGHFIRKEQQRVTLANEI